MIHTATLFAAITLFQGAVAAPPLPGSGGPPPSTTTAAVRAVRAPVIDGRDDDDVWRTAPPITEFREFDPVDNAPARFRTEARIAYDAHNFYVFIRAYDPEPQKILKLLSRRDIRNSSDQLKIVIDSYHDRRSGYEFAVNPGGVKRDYAVYEDTHEDDAWDGVWEVATQVDSLGWTAEFRIPLSQLRYPNAPTHTFGFAIWRDIERYRERVSWPLYHNSGSGFMSQLGDVTGLDGLSSPRRLEATPYVVAKNAPLQTASGFNRDQSFTAGADFKYGLTSNITLDGTVNPDFGQVEADPSVLNLSAFETFYQEKRPFFIEGTGTFRFDVNCSEVNCQGEGLFYSRRIGRAPQLTDATGNTGAPTATTILGAGKLTGRLPSGLTLGVLEAVTGREAGTAGATIEPTTNYGVFRLRQDLRGGETDIGIIATGVDRSLDNVTRDSLHSSAYVGGVDFRHRFLKGRYQIKGSITASRVAGTPAAIALTQTDATHFYQRPDALRFDSTRTVLSGDEETIHFAKYGGAPIHFETSYQRISPGYEVNDLGFLNRADWQDQATWVGLQFMNPKWFYKRLFWNFNEWHDWTAAGLMLEQAVNTNLHTELNGHWWVHAGATLAQLGRTFCDRCARGGPALRTSPVLAPWFGFEGDERRTVIPYLFVNLWRGDEGRSTSVNVNPSADLRFASQWSASVGLNLTTNHDNTQWYGNFDSSGTTRYTFAHLDQHTTSLSLRVNYTASPTLTLQVYASPFVSKGTFSNVREIANPRDAQYANRFTAYGDTAVTNNPGGFNFKQFRSNIVLRWEYKPGSTVFLVWTQGRQDVNGVEGTRSFGGDMSDLFHAHPSNTFLIKASHWFDW